MNIFTKSINRIKKVWEKPNPDITKNAIYQAHNHFMSEELLDKKYGNANIETSTSCHVASDEDRANFLFGEQDGG